MSVHDQLDEFCTLLRHRKVEGSLATGRRTAELLRIFVSSCRHSDAVALVEDVRSVGNKLQAAKPIGASRKLSYRGLTFGMKPRSTAAVHLCAELAIGNITRRVLHMIREESEQVSSVIAAALLCET